jgi:transglutaminase superfamily protein
MNLICAYGLTGKHDIEIEAMLKTLDVWPQRVAEHTSKRIGLFHKNRERFGSLARFRITAMIHVLTSEFNVHYNPDRITDPGDWSDHGDAFIHGALGPKRHGTCASLPVLFTAIGRRLGYPLYLTIMGNHCFCRWDSPEERFNIEYSHGGLNSHSDEHYKHWPQEWTPEVYEYQRKRPCWLMSLTPQQDLAYCAHTRATQLSVVNRHDEAHATQVMAYQLWPNKLYGVWSTHLLTKKIFREKKWPFFPCEETAGQEMFDKLAKQPGVRTVPSLDPKAR